MFSENPYPVLAELRSRWPVHYSPAVRGVVVTRYDLVQHVLREPSMSADRITPFYRAQSEENRRRVETLVRYLGLWLVFRDPPDHTRLRGLIARAFTPQALAMVRPNIERIVDDLMSGLADRQEVDLVSEFANLLPAYVIMDMLGVPRAMMADMKAWSDDVKLFIGTAPASPDKYDRAHRGILGFADAFGKLIAEHRREPRQDVLSALIAANEDGSGRLCDDELVATAILFLFAGHETTASLIAMGSMAMMDNPSEKQRLLAKPELVQSAVEECLRFDGPTPAMVRIATRDHTLHDYPVKEGDRVIAVLGAANRDPAVFKEPDRFDIGRSPNPHVTFGFGPHFCLGAPLARLEAQIALPRLHSAFPKMSRQSDKVPWSSGLALRGPTSLPVRLRS